MKKIILFVVLAILGKATFASETVVIDKNIVTPLGTLNVYVSQMENGVFDLLVTEVGGIASNAFMIDFPFLKSRKAFDAECKTAYVSIIKSYYPDISELITKGLVFDFSLSVNFDDRKELVLKSFWLNAKTQNRAVLETVISQFTNGTHLFDMIKEGAEQVYRNVPLTPRSELMEEIRFQVDNGTLGYYSNAYVRIGKDDLD